MSQLKPVLREEPTVYFVQFVPYAPKEVIGPSSLPSPFSMQLTDIARRIHRASDHSPSFPRSRHQVHNRVLQSSLWMHRRLLRHFPRRSQGPRRQGMRRRCRLGVFGSQPGQRHEAGRRERCRGPPRQLPLPSQGFPRSVSLRTHLLMNPGRPRIGELARPGKPRRGHWLAKQMHI